jgi:serine phosphatase RsbU (regulator of sigma subunit)/Flp pilus assembly protein TadD
MTLMGPLGSLESAGLVRIAQVEPDLEYLFEQTLVQEAAYESLLERDRQQLHLLVGEAIEQLYPERIDEYAAVLARHFEKAGEDQHALAYFIRAANIALEAYANKEAELHFRRALKLSCPVCERANLLEGLGEALYRQSRFEEAKEVWRDGIALFVDEKDNDGIARLYARLARITWHGGDSSATLEICEKGMSIVSDGEPSADIAMLIHETARSHYFNGENDKALPLCKKALAMAEEFNGLQVQADTLATYGVIPELSAEESLDALQKSVEISKKNGFLEIALRAYHNLGQMTSMHTGDIEMARHYLHKAADIGRQRGVAAEEAYSLSGATDFDIIMGDLRSAEGNLERLETIIKSIADTTKADQEIIEFRARLLWMSGQWNEAIDLARRVYQKTIEEGNKHAQLSLGTKISTAFLELHRYGELEDLNEIESILEHILGDFESIDKEKFYPSLNLATVRARQGRIEDADSIITQVREFIRDKPSLWNDTMVSEFEAEIAHRAQRYQDAISKYESVIATYKKANSRWSLARNMMDLAETCTDKGDPSDLEQARDLLREALILFDEMGAHRHKKLVEERLGNLRQRITAQAASYQRDAQELARAAQVQGSFLPEETPSIPGWDLAVTLLPARQTSGDYYDFIPLPDGRIGLLVADVADKGAAAALFMASSHSLIRTYAGEFVENPEMVLAAASRRLLADTHAGLFVTVFYGVLDPERGTLIYCNAGHTPAIYLPVEAKFQALTRTGSPLGVFEDAHWESDELQLSPGEAIVLYTDGVTDAQNDENQFFGEKGLLMALKHNLSGSAEQIRDSVLEDIRKFASNQPQFDDITLMVLTRNSAEENQDEETN